MALIHTPPGEIGQACPDFKLMSVDGKNFSKQDFFQQNQPVLIMFICNHCPYVKAIEDRLIQLGHDLHQLNIPVVGICSNDAQSYPEDSLDNLKKRAHEKKYSFVYLYDETQKVAQDFGAVCTPDFFLYDKSGKLAYRGRLDDSWKDPALVTRRELFTAAMELAENKNISSKQLSSMGCSIKWRK